MITFPDYALEQMAERGVSGPEVRQVIEERSALVARLPRLGREMVFPGGREWKGRRYPHKKVRAIFVRKNDDIVIVTIYSYYGRWEIET